jgi:uncharacterized membrane protein YphA (DoxX/SURF4 family)
MQVPSTPRWQRILGIVLTVLTAGMLLLSASAKLTAMPEAVEGFKQFGFPDGALFKIGIVEVLCVLLFVIPQTAILGAILIAAYLGGAVVIHVIKGDSFAIPVVLGAIAWAALWLRDPRLRDLFPIRR